jgi:ABC transporter fused permease/ATP-binding protein
VAATLGPAHSVSFMAGAPVPPRTRSRSASLGRLLALARPEVRRLALGALFLAVGTAASLLLPQAVRLIIDRALGVGGDPALLDMGALALVGLAALQAISLGVRWSLFGIAGERVVARLRTRLFDHLLHQEIAFFDGQRTGELVSRLSSDASVLQGTLSSSIPMALRFAATIVGGLGLLFWTSPRLTVLMLAVVPPVALGGFRYGRRVRKLAREVQDALARSVEVADEALAGVRTVRSFNAERHEVERYGVRVADALRLARRRILLGGGFMGIATLAAYSAAALVLWYGGRLVVDGDMSIGKLTSFLVYSLLVAFALGGLSDLWADLMRASGAAERIFELLDRPPAIAREGGTTLGHVEGAVELRGIHFAYPTRRDVPVVRGIDLAIRPGEAIAFVGPSGAGKSTLAALLLRLYDPDSGTILLDGHDLRALDPGWLRRQIGVVSQEPLLFATTVAENIRYGRADASDAEVEAAARAANAHDFIARFPDGYQTLVGERGVQLSGGQKQRVAIARAVLKNPRLLILDEATSALDAESEHLVKEALDRLMTGRTSIIIAHRLSTVVGADSAVVLDGGVIVQSGPHAALMAEDGPYRRLVERQFMAG